MKKQEILEKIGELAEKATVVDRKGLIEIPYHRLENWEGPKEMLLGTGFEQGPISYYIRFEKAKVQKPSIREKYNAMSEEEQITADLKWLEVGGHLSEEKMARLVGRGKHNRRSQGS